VVSANSATVTHLELLNTFQKMKQEEIAKKYPNSRFYLGLLAGSYELAKNELTPLGETTIIMYTEKQFYPAGHFLSENEFSPGDEFDLGKTKGKVMSMKKGELILKIE
jgi:hypothetical protein